jgi:hypothetical protein
LTTRTLERLRICKITLKFSQIWYGGLETNKVMVLDSSKTVNYIQKAVLQIDTRIATSVFTTLNLVIYTASATFAIKINLGNLLPLSHKMQR